MKISVAMIVKNEESCLARALESVKGFDEIVIVDTGSTDKTVEIAKKYTDKVYTDYKWNDNFAEARNHSLSKCSGDWILTIDADEKLQVPVEFVRKELKKAKDKNAINTTLKDAQGNKFLSPRVFKRSPNIFWEGAIHNYLNIVADHTSEIEIEYGYSEAHKLDPDRSLRILLKEVNSKPKLSREKYYLAREYWYRKDYITALYWYEEYLKVSKWKSERADAYLMASRCLWALARGDEAREYCMKAIIINPNFKEALLFMASISWEKNGDVFRKFAEIANNEDVLFIRKI
jgi:glycosyltransferase involved in cell wall biosynthesis